jgi:hypothetical protein
LNKWPKSLFYIPQSLTKNLQKAAFSKKKAVLTTKLGFKLRRKIMKYSWRVAFYDNEEELRWLDRRVKEEVLQKVKDKLNIRQKKTLKMAGFVTFCVGTVF